MLSQRQAAKEWAVSRVTIQRYIRDGKLSQTTDKAIDPTEMLRVFGEPPGRSSTGTTRPESTGESAAPIKALQTELSVLRTRLADKDAIIAAQAANLADMRGQVQRLTHDSGPARSRRSWWPWGKA